MKLPARNERGPYPPEVEYQSRRAAKHGDGVPGVTVMVSGAPTYCQWHVGRPRARTPQCGSYTLRGSVHPTSRARVSILAQKNGTAIAKLCREHEGEIK